MLVLALAGCRSYSQDGQCPTGDGSGEGTNVVVTSTGASPQEIGHTICVGGGPSGFSAPINTGTLSTLLVDTQLYTIGAKGVCGDNVDATLVDSPPNADEYQPGAPALTEPPPAAAP